MKIVFFFVLYCETMSKLFVVRNLKEENVFFHTILIICICALIILVICILNYLLYRLRKHILTRKSNHRLPQYITNDDKHLWINDRILNSIRHIIRTDNVSKMSRIRGKTKSKMNKLRFDENQTSNVFI